VKYLGLLAMSKILKTHPKSVQSHKDLILTCLDDKDESIRLRALDLLYGMVSKKNLMEIVKRLLGHMERAEGSVYRDELLFKIIEICSQGSYQHVTNFEWYLTVLVELIQLETSSKHGNVIAEQLLDVTIRVESVREFSVREMSALLDTFPKMSQSSTMHEVLYAAAYIVGEFCQHLTNPESTLEILLMERSIPGHIQAVYVQNIMKLYSFIATQCVEKNDQTGLMKLTELLLNKLPYYVSSGDIEVQERACSANMILQIVKTSLESETGEAKSNQDLLSEESNELPAGIVFSDDIKNLIQDLRDHFEGDLNPVANKAQKKILVPDGLNLDEPINEDLKDSASSDDESKGELFVASEQTGSSRKDSFEPTPEELEKV
jgi:AP-3 complex subunit delta-1